MRLRGAGGPPFAAGRVLAGARPRTAALHAPTAPPTTAGAAARAAAGRRPRAVPPRGFGQTRTTGAVPSSAH